VCDDSLIYIILTDARCPSRTVHTGGKVFSCDLCSRNFAKNELFPRHMQSVCRNRNASFTHKHQLGYHIRICPGEKPFPCQLCKKALPRKRSLDNHVSCHEHKFVSKTQFKLRARIYTREKQFVCLFCNVYFGRDHLPVDRTYVRLKNRCDIYIVEQ